MGANEKNEAQLGPYKSTTTTRITMAPVSITMEKVYESSHVPPPNDCGCGCAEEKTLSDTTMEAIQKMGAIIIEHLQKIRERQERPAYADPAPPADPSSS